MKKIKLFLLIATSTVVFTACGNKYSVENLKKDDKLLKETIEKCQEKKDNKICENVKKAQIELAQEAWDKAKPEIKKRLDKLSAEYEKGNLAASVEEMPEKFLKYQAEKSGTTVENFKNLTVKMMNNMTDGVKIAKISFDLEKVKVGRTDAGRNYAIIPSSLTMAFGNQNTEWKPKTLAFEDEGKWHMVNFDKDYLQFLKKIYPDIEEIDATE